MRITKTTLLVFALNLPACGFLSVEHLIGPKPFKRKGKFGS